jgi:ERF superfamily
MPNIYNKLHTIQQSFKIEKNQVNKEHQFKFYNLSDMINILKPMLLNTKTVLLFESDMPAESYLRVTAKLVDTETESSVSASAISKIGQLKDMDIVQSTGSAHTYTCRYALNALLAVSDGVDSDTTNDSTPFVANTTSVPKPLPQVIEEAQNVAILRISKEKGFNSLIEALNSIGIETEMPEITGTPAEIEYLNGVAEEILKPVVDGLTPGQLTIILNKLKNTVTSSSITTPATAFQPKPTFTASTAKPANNIGGKYYYPNIKDNYGYGKSVKDSIPFSDFLLRTRPEIEGKAGMGKMYFFLSDKNYGLGLSYDKDNGLFYTTNSTLATELSSYGFTSLTEDQINHYVEAKANKADFAFLNANPDIIKGITNLITSYKK